MSIQPNRSEHELHQYTGYKSVSPKGYYKMSRGILYIATREPFFEEAKLSASRIKEFMPDIPITALTDVDTDRDNHPFDSILPFQDPNYSNLDQIENMHRTPYDRTLCLDTDIYIDGDVRELFDILDEFDVGASINQGGSSSKGDPDVPSPFPEYNTGVIIYKNNSKFREFLKEWKKAYMEQKQFQGWPNQPTFREKLYQSNLRIATLPSEYNLMTRTPGHVREPVKIFHGRLHDFYEEGVGTPKYIDMERFVDKINNSDGHRVYTHGWSVRIHKDSILWKAKKEYSYRGIQGVVNKGINRVIQLFR